MKVRVEVVCLNADGDEQRRQVLTIERRELAMETLGMNLTEGKAVGRRAGFCSRATGTRRSGATTCVSRLPQAVHEQGLRQHPG
jgi:hypothetical protein